MSSHFPRRFGKYLLLRPMAKGGMGEIYMAALGQIGGFEKLCVIKKVLSEKADPSKAKRFLDEAKVVLRLSHSNLVNTFDAGEADGEFYIAMEMVEGKDLREVWNRCVRQRQRIPIEVALHVAREVARVLAYVHGYGDLKLVHRDIAPPNILLAYNGDVKLTDFGLARSKLKEEKTQPGVVFGRAAYLAPEQARGEVADARTDVYTLAIVLWELLTGHQYLPISGLDPVASLALVRHPKPVPPSSRAPWISPELDKVVLRALTPDRAQRFQSADEFRLALSDVIAQTAPRTDPARVVELMQTIFDEVIEKERVERELFLKEVIPAFRLSCPEAGESAEPAAPPSKVIPKVPLASLAAAEKEMQASRIPARGAKSKPSARPPLPPENHAKAASAKDVAPPKDSPEQRRTRREAAMRVLTELAAEEDVVTPPPEEMRK
jgi:eukaryotic-like serine/threonine-protein kinase